MVSLTITVVVALVAAALAGTLAWLVARLRAAPLRTRLEERDREVATVRAEVAEARQRGTAAAEERSRLAAELEGERRVTAEKLALLDGAERKLREAFDSAAAQALQLNGQNFLGLAQAKLGEFQQAARTDLETRRQSIDQLVAPVRDGLARVGDTLQKLEVDRASTHAAIHEQLHAMAQQGQALAGETQNLVKALRAPQVRGQWGEMQLRRVVELAGMEEHSDFVTQDHVETADGRLRPDLIVRLPGHKVVVVDSKAPLAAYLDAMEATDETQRGAFLDQHARQVRDHITALSAKDYANEYTEAVDFVVLFLPGEAFFSAACQRDPSLIEFAVKRGVIPASPTTLITVLKAVFYGWQQERIGRNAEEIRDLGQELYARMRIVAEHLDKVRKGLDSAVSAYNDAVGSLEKRVLPTARRFRDLGAGTGEELPVLEPVDSVPRLPAAAELVDGDG